MSTPFKLCACGRTFTRAEWGALPLLGVGFYEVGDAETSDPEAPIVVEECHESRNCPCGSTLSRKIGTTREAGAVFRTMLVEHGEMFEALRAVQARCTELVEEKRLREKLERSATYGKGVREIDAVSAYPFDLTNRVFGKFARGPADQRTGGPAERSLSPEHENHRIRSRIWHALRDLEKRLEDFVQAAPGFDEDAALARALGRAMANCRSAIETGVGVETWVRIRASLDEEGGNGTRILVEAKPPPNVEKGLRFLLTRIGSWTNARFDQHLRYELGDDAADEVMLWLAERVSPLLGHGPHGEPMYMATPKEKAEATNGVPPKTPDLKIELEREVEHLTHAIVQALDVAKMGARNEKMGSESCKQIWSQLETALVVAADRKTGTQHKHSFGPRGTGRCVCGVLP